MIPYRSSFVRLCAYRQIVQLRNVTSDSKIELPSVRLGRRGMVLWCIPVVTFGLGTWQVKRHYWKQDLIQNLNDQMAKEPIDLPQDIQNIGSYEYQKVKIKGRFDHSKEQLLGPRPLIKKEGFNLISAGDNGYLVVTPFKLSDRPYSILVNRGWVGCRKKDPNTRLDGQVEGEVEIVGVVRKSEPKNAIDRAGFWLRRDIDLMAKSLGTAPVFIDADAFSTVPGGPVGGQTRLSMFNNHFSYIITWYSLSLITTIAMCNRTFPKFFAKFDR
ncbi:surfeit locus protein 1 isoform X2 [Brevipalpus obovatus]|uniref:surfeit locus protein 1 isoform X2 n=1 Tax=Brevipalpus obovatus TaxID=246614 RepID=UPI003D9E3810